jgi:hypothetical protein
MGKKDPSIVYAGWWDAGQVPTSDPDQGGACMVGIGFCATQPGRIVGARYYKDENDSGFRLWGLYDIYPPTPLYAGGVHRTSSPMPSGTRWVNCYFRPWYRLEPWKFYFLSCVSQYGLWRTLPGAVATPPNTQNNIAMTNGFVAHRFDSSDVVFMNDLPGIDPMILWD